MKDDNAESTARRKPSHNRREETMEKPAILEHPGVAWKTEVASRLAVVIDGQSYFEALRTALISAECQVMFIGWDFDFLLEMLPGESDENGIAPDGLPNALGPFLEALCDEKPDLDIYLLKWNGAVLLAPGSVLPSIAMSYFAKDQVHFALDSHHPTGACHHQKIVVIDDALAFCGGIDATVGRWDTSEHLPDDPRRRTTSGQQLKPWHDVACAVTGDAARALGELARARWIRATGDELPEAGTGFLPEWPGILEMLLSDVPVSIARTEPPFDDQDLINEIERVTLAAIKTARNYIYLESQYLAAESILSAIEDRLVQHDGPEIVVLNPREGEDPIEHSAMHSTRSRWLEDIRERFPDRFRCYYPITDGDVAIYVHAKVLLVDDDFVKIGSSNINDRSLGFDTECDLFFQASEDSHHDVVKSLLVRLIGEHVAKTPETVADHLERHGSIIDTIEALNPGQGRRLEHIPVEKESMLDSIMASYKVFDPRFHVGEVTSTGRGLRPRHYAALLATAGVAAFFWRKWLRSR